MTPVTAVTPVTQHIILHAADLEAMQVRATAAEQVIIELRQAVMAADNFLHARYPQLNPEERALCERYVLAVGNSFAIVPEGKPIGGRSVDAALIASTFAARHSKAGPATE